tara:strand:+ start:567 stop:1463 length:897 start_codon:yes stop_codon:yes gene_type:complete
MRFGDISKTIFIILIFLLLYFSTIFTSGIKKIKDDWPQYRCLPTFMPLAGYIGKDPVANFSYCVGNIQKDMMGFFLEPIQYVLGMVMGMIKWILERVQIIRQVIDKIRNFATKMFGNVYGMFVNVLIQFQKLIIKTKDTVMKLIGTIVMFIYMIQGAMHTGQSIMKGPIGKTLKAICFSENTHIKLESGEIVKMKDIHLGDILESGIEVYGTLKLKGSKNNPYYQIWSKKLNEYIYVTGDHKICPNEKTNKDNIDNYIEVKDFKEAKKTDYWDQTLYCLITDNHTIPIGEYTFWDWED